MAHNTENKYEFCKMLLLIISKFGDINQPNKRVFIGRIKSVIKYLPRCSYHLLYFFEITFAIAKPHHIRFLNQNQKEYTQSLRYPKVPTEPGFLIM